MPGRYGADRAPHSLRQTQTARSTMRTSSVVRSRRKFPVYGCISGSIVACLAPSRQMEAVEPSRRTIGPIPPGFEHRSVTSRIRSLLYSAVNRWRLGLATTSGSGGAGSAAAAAAVGRRRYALPPHGRCPSHPNHLSSPLCHASPTAPPFSEPRGEGGEELPLMRRRDELHTEHPFYTGADS